jgi:hypothetical protein
MDAQYINYYRCPDDSTQWIMGFELHVQRPLPNLSARNRAV